MIPTCRLATILAISAALAASVDASVLFGAGGPRALAQSAGDSKSKSAPAKKSDKKSDKKKDSGDRAKSSATPTPAGAASPSLIGQFGGWGLYSASVGGRKVCFALAKPSSATTKPAGRPRDPSYMFVTTRPNEKVRDEVSINIGYPFKPGSEGGLEAGGARFALYTQGDGAWIKNAAEESRMVDAMRKAAQAVVTGTSAKGTETSDVFSMKGLAQALDRAARECP